MFYQSSNSYASKTVYCRNCQKWNVKWNKTNMLNFCMGKVMWQKISQSDKANTQKVRTPQYYFSRILHCLHKTTLSYLIFLGCGGLYVADGNWKLKYAHCVWKVPIQVEGFHKAINYPDIWPRSPERGKAFCTHHCTMAAQAKIPCRLHEFLKHCEMEKDMECRRNRYILQILW